MRPDARSGNGSLLAPRRGPAVALAFLVALASAAPSPGLAAADLAPEPLPADHPAWADVESLWNRGGLDGLPLFTRPLARGDVAAALAELRDRRPDLAATPPARRLARELAFELELLGRPGPYRETAPPLEWREADARLRAQLEARLSAITRDGEGEIPPGTRAGGTARAWLPGRFVALVDVSVEKILDENPLGDAVVKNSDWYLSTNEAYLAWRSPALDVLLGLEENRWGAGSTGTLLLSDAALPYAQLRLARTFGKRLRVVALTAALHRPDPLSDPGPGELALGRRLWLAAHRVELALAPSLVFGLHEAAAYRSTGVEPLYVVGVIPYTLVQRILDRTTGPGGSTAAHRNNVLVGADVAWRPAPGWRVDAELLVDDLATESASQPDRLAVRGGLSWAGRLAGSTADARVEAAKVWRWTYAVFYDADLIHDGVPLGYGRGPDVEHGEAWIERDSGTDLRLGAGLEWTRRGESPVGEFWDPSSGGGRGDGAELSGTVERRLFPHARVRVAWRDVVSARLKAGVVDVANAAHVAGADDVQVRLEAEARVQW